MERLAISVELPDERTDDTETEAITLTLRLYGPVTIVPPVPTANTRPCGKGDAQMA